MHAWQILLGIGMIYIGVKAWLDVKNHQKRVNWSINQYMKEKYGKKQPRWKPYPETEKEREYFCPNCGQPCTMEEYEHGFCLDCDQIEFFDDFEGEGI